MKVLVTLELDLDETERTALADVDLALLFRDALGEFRGAREPARDYIARRYGAHTPEFRGEKFQELEVRVAAAKLLGRASVTMERADPLWNDEEAAKRFDERFPEGINVSTQRNRP